MRKQKYYLAIENYEYSVIIDSLNNLRNKLIADEQGNYFIPCLTLPAEEEKPIGIWGQRHLRYLKTHRNKASEIINAEVIFPD